MTLDARRPRGQGGVQTLRPIAAAVLVTIGLVTAGPTGSWWASCPYEPELVLKAVDRQP